MPIRRSGFTLVEVLVCIAVIGLLAGLTMSAVQRARTAAERTRCANQLRQLGLALHQFHQSSGKLPPGTSGPADAMPYVAWTARMLPYLEQGRVWLDTTEAYRVEKNFLKPPHRWLSEPMAAFACPADPRMRDAGIIAGGTRRGLTSYLGVEGVNSYRKDGVLFLNSGVRLTDIKDGTANTLLVGERPPSPDFILGWWYAGWGMDQTGSGDAVLGVRAKNNGEFAPDCPTGPYSFRLGKLTDPCSAYGFWSLHAGGANFLFCDGAVRFVRYEADPIMPALATRSGGDVVDMPD